MSNTLIPFSTGTASVAITGSTIHTELRMTYSEFRCAVFILIDPTWSKKC